jgi:5-methyltetrahydrofolate--homocysteine methyltransferase|tara:strand:- start:49 stop:858 length:810 start_codon:yes stop_codon:yes gene_type:complete
MITIGENINATAKSVAIAINNRDTEFIQNRAKVQAEAGADYIDVNAGSGHGSQEQSIAAMQWVMDTVQQATDKPLVIDSDDPKVLQAALERYTGDNVIINSVTAESQRLTSIGSLAAKRQASLVALAMGEAGIPDNVSDRLAACDQIVRELVKLGVTTNKIYFDALVLPISVDVSQGMITLNTITQIKQRYPDAKTVVGLSNISYGLPNRSIVNRAFMLMAAYAGLDAIIVNPLDTKLMGLIKVADMLTARDPMCRGYIRAHRKGLLKE